MSTDPAIRSSAAEVQAALAEIADAADAVFLQRFFKTGPGQYGECDRFIGVRVPQTRIVAKRFSDLRFEEIGILLDSEIHEHRLAGLLIMVAAFRRASSRPDLDESGRNESERGRLAAFYLAAVRRGRVNNWDLIDASADPILGEYLFDQSRRLLFELAASANLWERREAIIATFAFIKRGDASTTLLLAERLLEDPEDLIHKAVGWMLREVGKRVDRSLLIQFLDENAARMPRTALRYAIEHLEPAARQHYRAVGRRAPAARR